MRVIISRKGFDSASGGFPSPIIDGRPRSLPIPTNHHTRFRYIDLPDEMGGVLNDLTGNPHRSRGYCHLDPDLDPRVTPRLRGWRGAFGQVGRAQSHLRNQGVGERDLFLFFGLFCNAVRTSGHWTYEGPREHRLFGWLQIDRVLCVGDDPTETLRDYPWLEDHPHTDATDDWPESNTIYIARKHLTFDGVRKNVPGWGLFPKGVRLTAEDSTLPSLWTVPAWLNPTVGGTGCTYNPPKRFKPNGELRSPGRGQEFVADITGRPDAMTWLRVLFEEQA